MYRTQEWHQGWSFLPIQRVKRMLKLFVLGIKRWVNVCLGLASHWISTMRDIMYVFAYVSLWILLWGGNGIRKHTALMIFSICFRQRHELDTSRSSTFPSMQEAWFLHLSHPCWEVRIISCGVLSKAFLQPAQNLFKVSWSPSFPFIRAWKSVRTSFCLDLSGPKERL